MQRLPNTQQLFFFNFTAEAPFEPQFDAFLICWVISGSSWEKQIIPFGSAIAIGILRSTCTPLRSTGLIDPRDWRCWGGWLGWRKATFPFPIAIYSSLADLARQSGIRHLGRLHRLFGRLLGLQMPACVPLPQRQVVALWLDINQITLIRENKSKLNLCPGVRSVAPSIGNRRSPKVVNLILRPRWMTPCRTVARRRSAPLLWHKLDPEKVIFLHFSIVQQFDFVFDFDRRSIPLDFWVTIRQQAEVINNTLRFIHNRSLYSKVRTGSVRIP